MGISKRNEFFSHLVVKSDIYWKGNRLFPEPWYPHWFSIDRERLVRASQELCESDLHAFSRCLCLRLGLWISLCYLDRWALCAGRTQNHKRTASMDFQGTFRRSAHHSDQRCTSDNEVPPWHEWVFLGGPFSEHKLHRTHFQRSTNLSDWPIWRADAGCQVSDPTHMKS